VKAMQDQSSVVSQVRQRVRCIPDRACDDLWSSPRMYLTDPYEYFVRLAVPEPKGRGLFRSEHERETLARILICQGQSGERRSAASSAVG
jgi:hypothetical protein